MMDMTSGSSKKKPPNLGRRGKDADKDADVAKPDVKDAKSQGGKADAPKTATLKKNKVVEEAPPPPSEPEPVIDKEAEAAAAAQALIDMEEKKREDEEMAEMQQVAVSTINDVVQDVLDHILQGHIRATIHKRMHMGKNPGNLETMEMAKRKEDCAKLTRALSVNMEIAPLRLQELEKKLKEADESNTIIQSPTSEHDIVARGQQHIENLKRLKEKQKEFKLRVQQHEQKREENMKRWLEEQIQEGVHVQKDLERLRIQRLKEKVKKRFQRQQEKEKESKLNEAAAKMVEEKYATKVPKFVELEKKFQAEVVMPELQRRKQILAEVRSMRQQESLDDIKVHFNKYMQEKQSHLKELDKRDVVYRKPTEWATSNTSISEFTRLQDEERRLQARLKEEALKERLLRMKEFACKIKPPSVDPVKSKEVEEKKLPTRAEQDILDRRKKGEQVMQSILGNRSYAGMTVKSAPPTQKRRATDDLETQKPKPVVNYLQELKDKAEEQRERQQRRREREAWADVELQQNTTKKKAKADYELGSDEATEMYMNDIAEKLKMLEMKTKKRI